MRSMSMSPPVSEESTRAYVADFECLMDGIMEMLALEQRITLDGDLTAIKDHYAKHPEDALCHIYRPLDHSMVLCRREGIYAIGRMAQRLVEEALNGPDLSSDAIAKIISDRIVQVMLDRITDDNEFVGLLQSYVRASEIEHAEISHHLPCVLTHELPKNPIAGEPGPDQFDLGPVKFRRLEIFLADLNQSVERKQKEVGGSLEHFVEAAKRHGWVASVSIPRCAPDVSRARAETIVGAGIDFLKLVIGLRHAKSMRLPHTSAARNRETCVLSEENGKVEWTWYGRELEGALVGGNWFDSIPQNFRCFAGHLLASCLNGRQSEATNRLVDALKWFGDASFEESSGVQIAKWVTALERLTTTGGFNTNVFSERVAILTGEREAGQLERAYRDAQEAYDLRCDVMHGTRSQDDRHFTINAGLVHDLTRMAILGGLGLHAFLEGVKKDARVESIADTYDNATGPFRGIFDRLGKEFSAKRTATRKARRPSASTP